MANTVIVSSIIKGSRIQPVSEGYDLKAESTTNLLATSQFEPTDSVTPQLKIGQRVTDYKSYIPKISLGTLAGGGTIGTNSKYKTIRVVPLGTRVPYDGELTHFALAEQAQFVNKIYTGISTHGIGYTPVASEAPSETKLRRWPRNWFGDNIKN